MTVENQSIELSTLITALFYDLTQDKLEQIPVQGERRERELQELVKKAKRPVALFVVEAHDLNGHGLISLETLDRRVIEVGGGRLFVMRAGHPRLHNDQRRPTMEEICYRIDIFSLDGIVGSQSKYIHWLLGERADTKTEPESILAADAVDRWLPSCAHCCRSNCRVPDGQKNRLWLNWWSPCSGSSSTA